MARSDALGRFGPASAPVFSLARIRAAAGVWRQRRALARLDGHLLDDLGLTEDEVRAEARRPFWDVPANWKA